MRQIFRIGVLLSALLIAVTGCASMERLWDSWGSKEADDGKSEQARSESADVATNGSVPSQIGEVHVLFAFDRADLNNTAQASLGALVAKLRENPKLTVALAGYADSVGGRDYNLQLSQKRVATVRRYFVANGIEPSRIRLGGLGQLTDRGTPEEQAKNRRVTVKLMLPKD
jgi:outer membrane protein OmpA-like peptidoglycan-associated protein